MLNYNLEAITDSDSLCWLPKPINGVQMRPKTTAIIHITMVVGINKITEASAEEFATRCAMWEEAIGVLCRDGKGKPDPITQSDVRQHIGLTTNAAETSLSKFNARLINVLRDEAMERMRSAA